MTILRDHVIYFADIIIADIRNECFTDIGPCRQNPQYGYVRYVPYNGKLWMGNFDELTNQSEFAKF